MAWIPPENRGRGPASANPKAKPADTRAIIRSTEATPFGDQGLHVHTAQHALDLPRLAFASIGVAQHQRVTQHFFQRDALVREQRMPCRHGHPERITPDRCGDDAVAGFVGQRETDVVKIIVQTLDQLQQRHFEKANLDFRLLLPAKR